MQLSQEAIKVDLGVQEDLRSYIFQLETFGKRVDQVRSLMNGKIKEYNDIAAELEKGASVADEIYKDAFQSISESDEYLSNLEKKLKDLGMSLGDFPNSQGLIRMIDESKDMLSSLGAARNVNPPKIGYRV